MTSHKFSDIAINASPIKKWSTVNEFRSSRLNDKKVIDRGNSDKILFALAECSYSNINFHSLMTHHKWYLVVFTTLSHNLPNVIHSMLYLLYILYLPNVSLCYEIMLCYSRARLIHRAHFAYLWNCSIVWKYCPVLFSASYESMQAIQKDLDPWLTLDVWPLWLNIWKCINNNFTIVLLRILSRIENGPAAL